MGWRGTAGAGRAEEVAGRVQTVRECCGRAEADASASRHAEPGTAAPGPAPGRAGRTLLAVVPIPGTGTSLAIVGYPVPGPLAP